MRLNRLELVNFRQHADTRIEFDLGLTGVIGPNGSGKSTILEAIAWALYGNSAARGKRESIRFNRADPRAAVLVELDFDLAGHRYQVRRSLTSAELYLDGADEPIANSIMGVTELLRRRLGMSREEFFNTYFTGQKELSVMAAMGPVDRGRFLSRVLGYEKLRGAQERVRDRRRLITAEISGLRSGMPDRESVTHMLSEAGQRLAVAVERLGGAGSRRAEIEKVHAAIVPRWASAQAGRERLQEILSELRVAESEAASAERELDRLDRELAGTAHARAELERLAEELAPLDSIMGEFQKMEELLREEGRRQALVDSIRSLDEELSRLADRRTRIDTAPQLEEEVTEALEQRRRELEEAEGALEARRTEWVRDRQEAETRRQALRVQYAELREQRERIVAAGEEGICPTCARPLGDQFRSVLDLLDGQVETVRVDGNYYKSRLEQLEEMPADVRALDERRRTLFGDVGTLERRLAKVQLAVQERAQLARDIASKEQRIGSVRADVTAIPGGYDRARHDELRHAIERLTPLDARAGRLGAQIDREPQLAHDREQALLQATRNRSRLEELAAARASIDFSESEYAAIRADHERSQADIRSAEVAVVAAQGEEASARAARESAEKSQRELEQVEARLAALMRDRRLHEELDRAFTDIRTDLNQALRPEISELASAFLTELTDARYSEFELDDEYRILVLEEGVPKPVISGGEEDLANLVLRLAISQMIAERAGQAFSLLILDEVFGSLDESRRRNVIELLRRLQDRFEQVILITHIESVREGLDRVIEVRYDDESGSSRVRTADRGVSAGEEAGGAGGDGRELESMGVRDPGAARPDSSRRVMAGRERGSGTEGGD
ncbi:MAG: AAA family ATPase [Gemmatimonadaceae bacterium]